eukprot:gene3271-13295_t
MLAQGLRRAPTGPVHSCGVRIRTDATRAGTARPLQPRGAKQKGAGGPVLGDSTLLKYERDGFLLTRKQLEQKEVSDLKGAVEHEIGTRKMSALRQRVRVLCPSFADPNTLMTEEQATEVLRAEGTDEIGFLQFFNLHRTNSVVKEMVMNLKLARTASQLLGVKKVRLFQDCVFLKEPGYAETNWHSDLRMTGLDTNSYVTAWIPLRPIRGGDNDSGLLFAQRSQKDFALPFWYDMDGRDLSDRGYEIKSVGAMELGDVSWHHGWILHCAGPQPAGTPARAALAISFFADGARLAPRKKKTDPSVRLSMMHTEDDETFAGWRSSLKDGAVAAHPLLPVVWPSKS